MHFFIDRKIRSGKWTKPSGISLGGKTLGIVGLGDIGKNIAKRAISKHAFEHYLGSFPSGLENYIKLQKKWPVNIEKCDFLVFACALNKETKHLLNDEILAKLKPGIRLINISRGSLIDESVLLKGLSKK